MKNAARAGTVAASARRGPWAESKNEHRVLVSRRGGTGVSPATVRRRAERMLAALGSELGATRVELSVALVDDATIRELNRRWRAKDMPTDVLAFPLDDAAAPAASASHGPRMLGDVILSLDTARRQAAASRRSLLDEVTMLLAHGLIHLLGYDHDSERAQRAMNTKTALLEDTARAGRRAVSGRRPAR